MDLRLKFLNKNIYTYIVINVNIDNMITNH